ncbi:DUF3618 domain-containing protein [Marisediminicola antarctica]|uniref:DUF3618 domain-containing protein n=1 Tax=Marisediminicola antarctica TaxID=674079 RepID=A0A7L5AIL0_9MICO|nr:DUF3618 domain-containing protein [Marisediminicola antarctica]QHO69902.1 hypothetical protein BHD05_09860 [Marisediminicola antarctica]
MARKKKDKLNLGSLISAIMKNRSKHRSMAKARAIKGIEPEPEPKKPRDIRTPEQIKEDVDVTRARLVETIAALRYDLDVPARARDLRDRVAARIPEELKAQPVAIVVTASVLVAGVGTILIAARNRSY